MIEILFSLYLIIGMWFALSYGLDNPDRMLVTLIILFFWLPIYILNMFSITWEDFGKTK